jgi:hypothetical protein
MGCFIELDDGKIFTGNPYIIIFDGKNHGKNHGFPVDFPLNQSSEMGASHGHHDWMRTGGSCMTLERS